MKNYLAIIPSRFASTRFPGKPLADIGGKPMIVRVIEQVSQVVPHVVVATDDERIQQVVEKAGGPCCLTSPEHLSGTDRCAEAARIMASKTGMTFDVVINIQGDEPFIRPEQIKEILQSFDSKEVQIATLAKPFEKTDELFNPNYPKVILNRNSEALYFSRSVIPFLRNVEKKEEWVTQHRFYRHIGMYAYKFETLQNITRLPQSPLEIAESLEQNRWIEAGYKIKVQLTPYETYGVDTPQDLEMLKKKGFF